MQASDGKYDWVAVGQAQQFQNMPAFTPPPKRQAPPTDIDLGALLEAATTSGDFPPDFAARVQEAGGYDEGGAAGKANPVVAYSTMSPPPLPPSTTPHPYTSASHPT